MLALRPQWSLHQQMEVSREKTLFAQGSARLAVAQEAKPQRAAGKSPNDTLSHYTE